MASKAQLEANALMQSMTASEAKLQTAEAQALMQRRVEAELAAFTPSEKARFIEQLEQHGNVHKACLACGISRRSAVTAQDRDPMFADAWHAALQSHVDAVEQSVMEQARDNTARAQVLAIFYLKSNRRETYGEQVQVQHTTKHDVVVHLTKRENSQLEPEYHRILAPDDVVDAEIVDTQLQAGRPEDGQADH